MTAKETLPELLQALEHGTDELSYRAAMAVIAMNDPSVTNELMSILSRSECKEVRDHAIYAVWLVGNEEAVPGLIEVLENAKEEVHLRGQAAEALGSCGYGNESAMEALRKALGSEHAEIRLFAANALAFCGDERAIPELTELLTDDARVADFGTVAEDARHAIKEIRSREEEGE